MGTTLQERLEEFCGEHSITSKGALAMILVLTDRVGKEGVPADYKDLLTKGEGQIKGAGKSAQGLILKRHGITRVLSSEAGRTSRGSIGKAYAYMDLVKELKASGDWDDEAAETFWIGKVRQFFAAKPFVLRMDAGSSIRSMLLDLFEQVREREKEVPGATVLGSVLQHLVGAKLELVLNREVDHHGASVADQQTGRGGDFCIGESAVHVTTAPSELLIQKCGANLRAGLKPWIVTIPDGVHVARMLAMNASLGDRIEVSDVEQFLTCNFLERGEFTSKGRRNLAERLCEAYNNVIDRCETDPSLKLKIG